MFPQTFTRILWKEYRVQKALWLSCLFIGIAFQLWIYLPITKKVVSEEDVRNLCRVAMVMSIMYAVGCAAILFAGEREERTTDWLLTLSVPPGWTLAAKLFCAIAAIVGLQAVLLFPGVLIRGLSWEQVSYFPIGFYVLAWALLGSLLSRRVLISIGVMIGYWVLICFIPISLTKYALDLAYGPINSWHGEWIPPTALYCALAIAIVADLWLGWRWCQGKYLDGSVVESWNGRFSKWSDARLLWRPKTTRLPRRLEHGQPWRRAWQRLVWQERYRERGHQFVLALGILLGVAFAVASKLTHDPITIPATAFMLAIPLAIGVLGFRSDSNGQQPRFLSNHGIAPGSVWLAKQAVWMTRAFVITGIVFAVSTFCEWLLVENGAAPWAPSQELYHEIRWHPDIAVWYVLAGYCSGQLAACIVPRVIIALLFGIVLNVVVCNWMVFWSYHNFVPRWMSAGPSLVAMLLVSLWQTTPWLMENYSWKRFSRLTMMLFAIPVVLSVAVAFYRSAEIPPANVNPKVVENWSKLRLSVMQPLSPNENSVLHQLIQFENPIPERTAQSADEITSLLRRELTSLHDPKELSEDAYDAANYQAISGLLRGRTAELTKSGDINMAFECLLADLRLSRLLAKGNRLSEWRIYSNLQRQTLNLIIELANHPSQTVESIREITKTVDHELNQFADVHEAIVASYECDRRKWVDASTRQVVRNIQTQIGMDHESTPLLFPWYLMLIRERTRLAALITRESQLAFARASSIKSAAATTMIPNSAGEVIQNQEEAATREWAATTCLVHFSSRPMLNIADTIHSRIAMKRAALVRLAIVSYRVQHGQLPERLIDLGGLIDGKDLIDPFSNHLFDYYPAFLLSAGEDGCSIELNSIANSKFAETPVVAGKAQFEIDQLTSSAKNQVTSTIETLVSSGLVNGYAYPIPPANTDGANP